MDPCCKAPGQRANAAVVLNYSAAPHIIDNLNCILFFILFGYCSYTLLELSSPVSGARLRDKAVTPLLHLWLVQNGG